jgi:hypothetical protein
MEFNYAEFKEKYGEEAADLLQTEIEILNDFDMKWQLKIIKENNIWVSIMLVTQLDITYLKVYKQSKAISSNRLCKLDCEQALKMMKELGA